MRTAQLSLSEIFTDEIGIKYYLQHLLIYFLLPLEHSICYYFYFILNDKIIDAININ